MLVLSLTSCVISLQREFQEHQDEVRSLLELSLWDTSVTISSEVAKIGKYTRLLVWNRMSRAFVLKHRTCCGKIFVMSEPFEAKCRFGNLDSHRRPFSHFSLPLLIRFNLGTKT